MELTPDLAMTPDLAELLQDLRGPGVAVRVRAVLPPLGVGTLRELLLLEPHLFLRQPNFGRGTLAALERALAARGLHLAGSEARRLPAWWRAVLQEET
jgi:hypothetical protein